MVVIIYYHRKSNHIPISYDVKKLGMGTWRSKIEHIMTYTIRYIETGSQNLRHLPDRFSPTSVLVSTVDYLEHKLLRFQGLICRINHFCNPIGLEFIAKKVKNINFTFLQICKEKTGKYFLFTFLAITSKIIKLEKHTI